MSCPSRPAPITSTVAPGRNGGAMDWSSSSAAGEPSSPPSSASVDLRAPLHALKARFILTRPVVALKI